MKIVTANRLTTGRVVYAGEGGGLADHIDQAALLEDAAAEAAVAAFAARPDLYVGPYAVEVRERTPSGRDRLRERIRSAGPTVGHSLGAAWREGA